MFCIKAHPRHALLSGVQSVHENIILIFTNSFEGKTFFTPDYTNWMSGIFSCLLQTISAALQKLIHSVHGNDDISFRPIYIDIKYFYRYVSWKYEELNWVDLSFFHSASFSFFEDVRANC